MHELPGNLRSTRWSENPEVLRTASGPAQAYLATEIVTATPRRLAQLLYDSAIRLCRESLSALEDGNAQSAAECIARARAVMIQLQRFGCPGWGPLYDRLGQQMVEAAAYRSREAIAGTLEVLLGRRAQWAVAAPARAGSARSGGWVG